MRTRRPAARASSARRTTARIAATARTRSEAAATGKGVRRRARVSPLMSVAGDWAWRFLVLAAALALIGYVVAYLSGITIPLAVAILLTALLNPVKDFLVRRGMKATFAAPTVFVAGIVIVIGIITAVVQQFIVGAPELAKEASDGLDLVHDWIISLGVSQAQIDNTIQSAQHWFRNNEGAITSSAVATAGSAGHILAGLAITLFALFFFLRDGRRIWNWVVGLTPAPARPQLDAAGDRAWTTVGGYVKATVLVAAVDAIGIGIVIAIVGVPLVIPLAAMVFLTAFIPLIGATLSGIVATLVALVAVGPIGAAIVLGGVLLVQQLEGHLLQPLLMGRAVQLHPLAVVLVIATGGLTFGITGALLAVPITAAINAAIKQLRGMYDESPETADAPDD